MKFKTEKLKTDILIIGGGTAGCYAAFRLTNTGLNVLIAEKADIRRSGCLAAGVNALNAYITEGHVPEDYVEYAEKDDEGIVRHDLLLSIAERFNEVTSELEKLGLVILKDENGKYVTRGWRNIKINGENIKPMLEKAVRLNKDCTVLNHVNITDLKVEGSGSLSHVKGAVGFAVNKPVFYDIDARAVIIATGGASGLYRPNNPGFSRHKMWYSPFNTGAGYAMGIRAGAEMTTFENRFVALRCKDTIAPTGTIAQGVHAPQVNSIGEVYEKKYGITTPQRIYGTVVENREGRGPCFLKTEGISPEAEQDLYKAYLNMAPSQTLKWMEEGKGPAENNVEIEGTEPYVVGGHTASGFWVDTKRETTVRGLFAAGDAAGGAPQKYVTGALAEGEIAALSAEEYVENGGKSESDRGSGPEGHILKEYFFSEDHEGTYSTEEIFDSYKHHFSVQDSVLTAQQAEEAMQKIMDEYAGGIRTDYRYSGARLKEADIKISQLQDVIGQIPAKDMHDLLHIYEVRERLTVCRVLIAHLSARKETRWHIFGENADYPEKVPEGMRYINSRLKDGCITIIERSLVKGGGYEHQDI
jgi:adenylylsulfate reductase subunit A